VGIAAHVSLAFWRALWEVEWIARLAKRADTPRGWRAPVMLPVWLAHDQLAIILTGVVPAVGFQGVQVLAWAWLGLFAVWLPLCGVTRARALRYGWFELLACVLLYARFSPLMAFALYFGAYHAPVRI